MSARRSTTIGCAAGGTTSRSRRTRPTSCARCSKGSPTTAAGCSATSRSSRASRSRGSTSSAGERSRGCGAGSWPTCSTARSARSSTRSAPTRAARPRSPRSRSAGPPSTTSRSSVDVVETFEPDPATRATYDELYREFRAIHKQTKGIYARLHDAWLTRDAPDDRRSRCAGGACRGRASSTGWSIVSPHLDDAVLGCANFMAAHPGATVVTVFAGNPPEYPTDPMRKWDVQSGFAPGDDVMETRRHEDARRARPARRHARAPRVRRAHLQPRRPSGRARAARRRARARARRARCPRSCSRRSGSRTPTTT